MLKDHDKAELDYDNSGLTTDEITPVKDDSLCLSDLKKEINNFVWMFASDETTIKRADEIAIEILHLLRPALRSTI